VKQVVVRVWEREIPKDLLGGDYEGDPAFRARMQAFVQGMWTEKDRRIEEIVLSLRTRVEA
jgi:hypothetical protein